MGDFQGLQLEKEDMLAHVTCQNGSSALQTFTSDVPPPVTVTFPATTCGLEA